MDGIGVGEECLVTSVVLEGRADVVSFAAMGGEVSALRRSFEGEEFSSGDGHWYFVEVKSAK